MKVSQNEISEKNSEYWNELCGSSIAVHIGISDYSLESLKKYDDFYFSYYPYLSDHIPFLSLANKNVLEVGLGYGSVSQRLVESGAIYTGLDIAEGPLQMVRHRFEQHGLSGELKQGSILDRPFSPESFDYIVAIGSLHHTGDLKLAIDRCRELLKPGGTLVFMVYYAYSYRRFRMSLIKTIFYWARERMGYRGVVGKSSKLERDAYDGRLGETVPHTDWISVRSLANYCRDFSLFSAKIENFNQEFPFCRVSRKRLLESHLPSWIGLDLFATAKK